MKSKVKILFTIAIVLAFVFTSCDSDVSSSSGTSSSSSSTTASITTGTATSLTDTNGDAISSGSATVTFTYNSQNTSVDIEAAYLINGVDVEITSGEYASASSSSDQVVFLVVNGGSLTITGTSSDYVEITKSGSAASGGQVGDEYNFYGINSAIVVSGSGSTAEIKYANITTSANGANAVVATNSGSIGITNSSITSTGNAGARGLHATYDGEITAESVTISTTGNSCASLATDRGGGTITATSMTLNTSGTGSPLVYSTDVIKVYSSTGAASGSQMVVVEGGSTGYLENCEFTCTGNGNRTGTSDSDSSSHTVDAAGIFIYQSQSGDSSEGTDYFTAKNCTLTVTGSSVPLFYITNITAQITISGTGNTFSYSGNFLTAEATSEWGSSGSNGAAVTLTSAQSLTGSSVYVGSTSSLSVNGTSYTTGSSSTI